MQRTLWIRSGLLAVIVGIALAMPAGAATPDAWITTKTKLALLTTEGVSGTAIKVDTVVRERFEIQESASLRMESSNFFPKKR